MLVIGQLEMKLIFLKNLVSLKKDTSEFAFNQFGAK
jgi:hypothetical protein